MSRNQRIDNFVTAIAKEVYDYMAENSGRYEDGWIPIELIKSELDLEIFGCPINTDGLSALAWSSKGWLFGIVAMRSNNYSYRVLHKQTLSRQSASSEIHGCRHREDIGVPHQQFHLAGINHNSTVSQQVAGGTFFQMDQAAPKDIEILWYFRECRKNTGLDSSLCLYPRCDNEKAAQPPRKSLHNFTNFESVSFRKDRTLSIGYRKGLQAC